MTKIKTFFNKLFYPPTWILFSVPIASFVALIFIFVSGNKDTLFAVPVYTLSAYSLIVLCLYLPRVTKKISLYFKNHKVTKWILSTRLGKKYFNDLFFRESISIYQGITTNAFYTIFNAYVGLRYKSAWFISIAVYYFALSLIKYYLVRSYKHRGTVDEVRCYKNSAIFLLLLSVPMIGMIILILKDDFGFTYSEYVLYLSAMYTLYSFGVAVWNIFSYRKVGSPILSATKFLTFVAAMMSLLALQTAMLSRFTYDGEAYKYMMNMLVGNIIVGTTVLIALYMLIHSYYLAKKS